MPRQMQAVLDRRLDQVVGPADRQERVVIDGKTLTEGCAG